MKIKLLLLSFLCSGLTWAQSPVASYYGTDNVVFTVVNPAGANHTPTGANAVWNFTGLVSLGESTDSQTLPTPSELLEFPGTTAVVSTESVYNDSSTSTFKVYSKSPANALSITGIDNSELMLNYSSNNALLGTFPLEYGYNNIDNVSGNYDNGQYAGTFSGTINTTVDAWGTLTISGQVTGYSGVATRLKTVQNLTLNYGIFTNVGTISITTYSYYGNNDLNPAGIPRFRNTITVVNVPLLSIDQTVTQSEAYSAQLLGTAQPVLAEKQFGIVPNPVNDILFIQSIGLEKIQSVTLSDLSGKIILADHSQTGHIDVSALQKGIYFAAIETESGTSTRKFIKK